MVGWTLSADVPTSHCFANRVDRSAFDKAWKVQLYGNANIQPASRVQPSMWVLCALALVSSPVCPSCLAEKGVDIIVVRCMRGMALITWYAFWKELNNMVKIKVQVTGFY